MGKFKKSLVEEEVASLPWMKSKRKENGRVSFHCKPPVLPVDADIDLQRGLVAPKGLIVLLLGRMRRAPPREIVAIATGGLPRQRGVQ